MPQQETMCVAAKTSLSRSGGGALSSLLRDRSSSNVRSLRREVGEWLRREVGEWLRREVGEWLRREVGE
jgi:hypothetical protein